MLKTEQDIIVLTGTTKLYYKRGGFECTGLEIESVPVSGIALISNLMLLEICLGERTKQKILASIRALACSNGLSWPEIRQLSHTPSARAISTFFIPSI